MTEPIWLQLQGDEVDHLRALIEKNDDALTKCVLEKIELLTADRSVDETFRQGAVEKYAGKLSDGDADFQYDGLVSRGDDGAYVMAFLWVSNADVGLDDEPEEGLDDDEESSSPQF